MIRDEFLRSINIQLDVEHPSRLVHFRPTSKSISLIESVFDPDGERSLLVVAPYGSGKSLTAGYLLHAVQNEPERFDWAEALLETMAERVGDLRPELGRQLHERYELGRRGIGVSLHGDGKDTSEMIGAGLRHGFLRAGLGREARSFDRVEPGRSEAAAEYLQIAIEKMVRTGRDHLLIVWDEFGRHLESMVADGRPGELLSLQVLAEAASRAQDVTVSVLLLLHRSFMGYAAGLPTAARQEWTKIEGRFRVVQYVDDSLEMHRLLASVTRDSRPEPPTHGLPEWAERSRAAGILSEIGQRDLTDLLRDAWPLEPAALWLLPRVAARVAQNERTAFSFLNDHSLADPLGPGEIYDYFRGEFRNDTGPGGTHRAWLETESALAKLDLGSLHARVIKAAFLLNLGLGGERARTPRRQLEEAVRGYRFGEAEVSNALDELIDRKLLIHRMHADQVMVWHGTDVDLRGRLEDERRRLDADFQLVPFLAKEVPPPVWRPTRHNGETGVPRYLTSRFVDLAAFEGFVDHVQIGLRDPGFDGEVLYIVPASDEERKRATAIAAKLECPRTVISIAKTPEVLRSTALELAALLRMHHDAGLLNQDPMVRPELDHLTDDVRQAMRPLLDRIFIPGGGGADWYHLGRPLSVSGAVAFRSYLSVQMDDVFSATPKIMSEMVVRRKPTPVVINARKKVVLGILERYGRADLGIEGNFADKAIFRSVLLRTGLYVEEEHGRWRLAVPEELADAGLTKVWQEVREFFSEPGTRTLDMLTTRLLEPPFGIREGLIPLLIAAGLKAFPTPKAIRANSSYVSDILPSSIEEMARSPGAYTVDVLSLSPEQEEYLQAVLTQLADFVPDGDTEDDLVRRVYDAIHGWWTSLPKSARSSTAISPEARRFRDLIQRPDPATVLLQDLPRALAGGSADLAATTEAVFACLAELEGIQEGYVQAARESLRAALGARGISTDRSISEAAREWTTFFPPSLSLQSLSPIARATLLQLRREHASEKGLLNALALLVAGQAFKDWTDATVPDFERKLRTALDDIEHAAMEAGSSAGADSEIRVGLLGLARARLRMILRQMAAVGGENRTLDLLEEEIESLFSLHSEDG